MSDKTQLSELRAAIVSIARDAAKAILEVYEREFDVLSKDDKSPLTEADLAAHAIIIERLTALTPDTPCLSEEGEVPDFAVRQNWQRYWLIDPLDGTKEFVNRNGEFTVNIALIEDGFPALGVVHVPVTNETFSGGPELGAFLQEGDGEEQDLRVAGRCEGAVRVVASRSHRGANLEPWLAELPDAEFVPCGSSLKFCRVACGDADVYPRFGPTSEWDTGAAQAVAEGAGARVITLNGHRLRYNSKESVLNPYFIVAGPDDHDWLRAVPADE
ncbi:MAG: 3'(2'),5'-bisphosphate nucleotidase CysQ [Pseudomonadota bacterium]